MSTYYWYNCDHCDYRAYQHRNVWPCECGGNLIREEPRVRPNRVVIETHRFDPLIENIRAERPNDILIIIKSRDGAPDEVWGNGGLMPIEPLGVADRKRIDASLG